MHPVKLIFDTFFVFINVGMAGEEGEKHQNTRRNKLENERNFNRVEKKVRNRKWWRKTDTKKILRVIEKLNGQESETAMVNNDYRIL